MGRTETFFYRFIDRRPWRRLIIAAGLIGYFAISVTFLLAGLALIPLRWLRTSVMPRGDEQRSLASRDLTVIN